MTDISASTVPPVGISTKAKKRHTAIEKFPLRFTCSITTAMGESLKRMTGGPNCLLAESDIVRLALNAYLQANDPNYARAMRGPGN